MERVRYGFAAVLLVGSLAAPAAAGTEDDPEVQRDCAGGATTVEVAGEHAVCAAWFASGAGPAGLQVTGTVRTKADLSRRTAPVRVVLTWQRADGCREGWRFSEPADAPDQLEVLRQCADGTGAYVALEPARAVVSGRDIAVTLTAEDLARVGSGLSAGARLSRPVASSMLLARSSTASVEVATGITDAGPGRDHVLPS